MKPVCKSLVVVLGASLNLAAMAATPTATWTSLTSSANPSVVGQSVTFTATVRAEGGGTPTGTVTFTDTAAVLGTASLDGLGRAGLTTSALPVGTRQIKATYAGTADFASSASEPLAQAVPAALGACSVPAFTATGPELTELRVEGVGDFNSDGRPDLVASRPSPSFRTPPVLAFLVLLNDGFGGFTPGAEVDLVSHTNRSVFLADFNLDGKLDFVVMGLGRQFAFGDGQGGLTAGPEPISLYSAAGFPRSMVVADFDRDGVADIAYTTWTYYGYSKETTSYLDVIFTDGGGPSQRGTFLKLSGDLNPSLVTADFNSDGKPDLALSSGNKVQLLFVENGRLVEGPITDMGAVSNSPSSVPVHATGDFNLDGKPDLINGVTGGAVVRLGDGSSGFSTASTLSLPQNSGIRVGDFNLDGKPDLVVSADFGYTVLLGNGAGHFQPSGISFDRAPGPPADFNQDGILDLVGAASTGTVVLSNCAPAPTLPATTTTLSSTPNPSPFAQSVTLTATVQAASGSGSPTGFVQFLLGGLNLGAPVSVSSGTATITTSSLISGPHVITAWYRGDSSFAPNISAPLTQTVRPQVRIAESLYNGFMPGLTRYFLVTLSGAVTVPVTVNYTTVDGSAKAGTDYVATSGTVTVDPGDTSKQISVLTRDYWGPEATRDFSVTVSNPINADLGQSTVGVSILASATPKPQFRLYSPVTREHLYTTDANEYAVLGTRGWFQEGMAYSLLQEARPGRLAMRRLYRPEIFKHLWTTDANESTVLSSMGWSYEGVIGYMYPDQVPGTVPLYRLMFPSDPPLHLWTTDANEKTVLSTQRGWVYEGILGYVIP